MVVLLPEGVDVSDGDADGSLVCLAHLIHLLLVLPLAPSNCAGPKLDELDVLGPNPAGVLVQPDVLNNKLVGARDGLASMAGVIVQVVPPTDVVEVLCPQIYVQRRHERLVEDEFGFRKIVHLQLHSEIFNPDIGLRKG